MKGKVKLEILINGMFFGAIRTNLWGGEQPPTYEEIAQEVESRLPCIKNKTYSIRIS